VEQVLSPDALRRTAIFHPAAVENLVTKLRQPKPASELDEMALVGVISTQLWHRQFLESPTAAEPLTDRDDVKVVDGIAGSLAALVPA
jgi:asparagine synthase (glutamine-hydrolysing)